MLHIGLKCAKGRVSFVFRALRPEKEGGVLERLRLDSTRQPNGRAQETKQTLKHNKTRKRIAELSLNRGRSNVTIMMMMLMMMMELWYR
jgi:hypothetical protein